MLSGMIDVGSYRAELDRATELVAECRRVTVACRSHGARVADMYSRYAEMWLAHDRACQLLQQSRTAWERAGRSGWQVGRLVFVDSYIDIAQTQAQRAIDIAQEIVDYVVGER